MRILRILAISITPASLVIWYFRAKGIIIYELLIVSHDVHKIQMCWRCKSSIICVQLPIYKGWIRITRIVCGVSRAQVSEWIHDILISLYFFYFLLFFKTLFQYSACIAISIILSLARAREKWKENTCGAFHTRAHVTWSLADRL